MTFSNPIEILDLTDYELIDIDQDLIQEKREALQDKIETGQLDVLVTALENCQHLEYYYFIHKTPLLQSFLSNGDAQFFHPYTEDAMYEQPGFIQFISPWFASSYNQLLHKLFRERKTSEFLAVAGTEPLILPQHRDDAYAAITDALRQFIDETNALTEKVTTGLAKLSLVHSWAGRMDIKMINALPSGLQHFRIDCALAIKNLAVAVFNCMQQFKLGFTLLDEAIQYNTDSVINELFLKERGNLESAEKASVATFTLLDGILRDLQEQANAIGSDDITAITASEWVKKNIDPAVLNDLHPFANKKRREIAIQINSLANTIYDKFLWTSPALPLVKIALAIRIDDELTTLLISENLTRLEQIHEETGGEAQYSPLLDESSSGSGSRRTVWIVVFIIIGLIRFGWYCNKKQEAARLNAYYTSHARPDYRAIEAQARLAAEEKRLQFPNGGSPFNACFGEANTTGADWLGFENKNKKHAIVCIVDVKTKKTIRNLAVAAENSALTKKVPAGTYYVKFCLGSGWSADKENHCGSKGALEYGVQYFKLVLPEEQIKVGKSPSSFRTLPIIKDDKIDALPISEKEFFEN